MSKKSEKSEKKNPSIKISKREPGKAVKQNFMQNLRQFPALPQTHPVEDLLFLNPENSSHSDDKNSDVSESPSFGNPNFSDLATSSLETGNPNDKSLDDQNSTFGNPNENCLVNQSIEVGNPNESFLVNQTKETGNPNSDILATQMSNFGNPNEDSLGANQPKTDVWQPKLGVDTANLDAVQPKDSDLATQKEDKQGSQKFLKKYDRARSTKPFHTRISDAVDNRIRHFIVDHDFTLKHFVEIAATKFMDEFGNPNNSDLGGNQPYDERRLRFLWKTKPALINLYLRYNLVLNPNSKWTVGDDDAACKFNDSDIRLIELGIIQTQANKKFSGKIASFGYYANEIQNFIELNLPEESLGVMVEINRKRWTQATGRELDLKFLEAKAEDETGNADIR